MDQPAKMDLQKTIETYNQYQRNIYNSVFNSPSYENFKKSSSAGKRREMIELLINLPQVRNIKINDCSDFKDDIAAEKIFQTATTHEPNHNTIQLLNKSLLAANIESKIYWEILMERIRYWFKTRIFTECLKDVKYFTSSASKEHADFLAECKIECHLIENEIYKIMKQPENAKNALNKAMAELNLLAEKTCTMNENIKQTKQNLLQMFLQKLKKGRDSMRSKSLSSNNTKIAIPKLYGQAHNLLKCCSNSISSGYSVTKGRYLYANRDIPVGSTVIVDQPFSSSINRDVLHSNCLHCYTCLNFDNSVIVPCTNCQSVIFCSEECRKASWKLYHEYECPIFSLFHRNDFNNSHLLLAYRSTISNLFTEDKKLNRQIFEFENLTELGHTVQKELKTLYDPLDYKTVCSLETHCAQMNPSENLIYAVRAVFFTKCLDFVLKKCTDIVLDDVQKMFVAVIFFRHVQIINCNAYEIVENVYDCQNKIWEPRNVGGAIYATVSLTNHSCYPNVIRHSYPGGIVVVRTTRLIKKGDEILDNYGPHFLTSSKTERQEYLSHKYHFNCCCEPCNKDWPTTLTVQEFKFKCSSCSTPYGPEKNTKCSSCGAKININAVRKKLKESEKKRIAAVSLMLENKYDDALSPLLKHLTFIDSVLCSPNLEIIKTQQTIVQCYNSMSSIGNC